MSLKPFSLIPFPLNNKPQALKIQGTISREADLLSIHYALIGNTADILLPSFDAAPLRKDNLWKTTCFELFLAEEGTVNYWEFNLSPSGNWNVYSFVDYRQNMREEAAYNCLPLTISKNHEKICFALEIPLENIIGAGKNLEAAVCAVINHHNRGISYWALTHCGSQPDFHLRKSFIIKL